MHDLRSPLRRAGDDVWPPEDPFERLIRRRDRRRARERVMAGAVALTLMAGLVGGGLLALSHTARHTAGRTLGRGASIGSLGEGQFVYRVQTIGWGADHAVVITSWWAGDGSGRLEFECQAAGGDCSYGPPPTGRFGPGQFPTDDDMTGLSTRPDTLLAQIEQRVGEGGSSPEPAFSPGPELEPGVTVGSVLDSIVNILEDPNGDPAMKAAAYEVAAGQPGVTTRNGQTDPAGRPATVLEFAMDTWGTVDYFFDPATHLLMAERGQGDSAGTTIYDQGVVDSVDAVPTADQWSFPPATG